MLGTDRIPAESVGLVTNFIGFHHAPSAKLEGFVRSIWCALKPGGRLIVRDHDADSPKMDAMVALAHDVFNAGLGIPWGDNQAQVRNFTSVAQLERYLRNMRFRRTGKLLLQYHDLTRNTLAMFVKPATRET